MRVRCQDFSAPREGISPKGPRLCQEILKGLDFEVEGFCKKTSLKPTKNDGYVQVSWGGANKFCVLGELLLWAGGFCKSQGQQCSHLCHQPLCLEVSHVCLESVKENNDRKGCLVWVECPHKDCALKIFVCVHSPPCIKYAEGWEDWEHFLRNGIHLP